MAHQVILGLQQPVCMKFPHEGHESWIPWVLCNQCMLKSSQTSNSRFCQDKKQFGKLWEMMMVIAAKTRKWAKSTTDGMGCGGNRVGSVLLCPFSFLGNYKRILQERGLGVRPGLKKSGQPFINCVLSLGFHSHSLRWENHNLPWKDSGQ